MIESANFLPVDVVFHPSWWYHNYGLTFTEDFFFDPETRVESERRMRQALYERFGDLGLGEKDASPRPVVGPVHLAAGFMMSALLGCEVLFFPDASPEVLPANLTDEQVMALEVPDIYTTSPMRELIAMMDALEEQYGYLEGDINWSGVQNVALDLRGQQLLLNYYDNPALVRHLFDVIARTLLEVMTYIRARTKTTSYAVNRIVGSVDPSINLHSNCSITMISAPMYEEYLLSYECYLAERMWPYGIHHCGTDLHRLAQSYAKVPETTFFDVGWGSDVALCREALPEAIFSLRLSPVRLKDVAAQEVEADVEALLSAAGPLERAALCCVNMGYGVPDENVRRIFEVAERYRRYGA
jgi:hypothetical protein